MSPHYTKDQMRTRDLTYAWGSIWLHGNWRYLTANMSTPEREAAADEVTLWNKLSIDSDGEGSITPISQIALRWWRYDLTSLGCRTLGRPCECDARQYEITSFRDSDFKVRRFTCLGCMKEYLEALDQEGLD